MTFHQYLAKARDSMADSLATAAVAMVDGGPDAPGPRELRRAFLWSVHPANAATQAPPELAAAVRWLRARSLLLTAIADRQIARRVLHQLTVTLDGRPSGG